MRSITERKAAILAKIAERTAERGALREQLTAKAQELTDMTRLRDRLQALANMTYWAELASGASIKAGDRVRYLTRTYECTQAHSKALLRLPTNNDYWTEVYD